MSSAGRPSGPRTRPTMTAPIRISRSCTYLPLGRHLEKLVADELDHLGFLEIEDVTRARRKPPDEVPPGPRKKPCRAMPQLSLTVLIRVEDRAAPSRRSNADLDAGTRHLDLVGHSNAELRQRQEPYASGDICRQSNGFAEQDVARRRDDRGRLTVPRNGPVKAELTLRCGRQSQPHASVPLETNLRRLDRAAVAEIFDVEVDREVRTVRVPRTQLHRSREILTLRPPRASGVTHGRSRHGLRTHSPDGARPPRRVVAVYCRHLHHASRRTPAPRPALLHV